MDQGSRKPKQSLDRSFKFIDLKKKNTKNFGKDEFFCFLSFSSVITGYFHVLGSVYLLPPFPFHLPLPFMNHNCQSSEKKLKLKTKKKEKRRRRRELKVKFKKKKKTQNLQFGAMQIKINSIKFKYGIKGQKEKEKKNQTQQFDAMQLKSIVSNSNLLPKKKTNSNLELKGKLKKNQTQQYDAMQIKIIGTKFNSFTKKIKKIQIWNNRANKKKTKPNNLMQCKLKSLVPNLTLLPKNKKKDKFKSDPLVPIQQWH